MKLVSILLILTVILIPSCTEYANSSYTQSTLCGTWEWVRSSGGFTGKQNYTPESVGYTKQLRFSSEGKYQEYHGNTLAVSSRYSVEMKKTRWGYQDVICFSDTTGSLHEKVIMKLSRTTLHLSDPYPDGYGHIYIRGEDE